MNDRNRDHTTASRRDYLTAVGGGCLAGLSGLAGCTGDSQATGTLATEVKDAPGDIGDFESCVVTVAGVWVKASEGDGDDGESTATETSTSTGTTSDGVTTQTADDVDEGEDRTYYEFEEPREADLVKLQDGTSQLLGDHELPVGTYQFLQLDVTGVEATLADGGDAEVSTPGNAPLQFKERFEIRADQTTTFVADFTPVKRGRTGRYLFQPVASGTEVRYAETTDTATETTTSG